MRPPRRIFSALARGTAFPPGAFFTPWQGARPLPRRVFHALARGKAFSAARFSRVFHALARGKAFAAARFSRPGKGQGLCRGAFFTPWQGARPFPRRVFHALARGKAFSAARFSRPGKGQGVFPRRRAVFGPPGGPARRPENGRFLSWLALRRGGFGLREAQGPAGRAGNGAFFTPWVGARAFPRCVFAALGRGEAVSWALPGAIFTALGRGKA